MSKIHSYVQLQQEDQSGQATTANYNNNIAVCPKQVGVDKNSEQEKSTTFFIFEM
jgi:hypothetical protein